MRILYVTTIGITMGFFNSFIRELLDEGHVVDIATNESGNNYVPACYREWGCNVYQINTSRSPLNKGNFVAVKQIKQLVEQNKYDIVHCHTPVAAMCTRFACIDARKKGTKVFYTAHGFHFYKGAPLKNWMLYYPIEKLCSRFTDVLITMNKEDYFFAQKKMKAKKIEYVPGVGIDLNKFSNVVVQKDKKRNELGVPQDACLILSVGELNENKNHETVIRAIKDLDVYYIIAGKGELQRHLQDVICELGLAERIKMLGYRTDVAELYQAADVYVLPSIREGLNVSIMEAMASGLPVVCGRIRGNTDMIDENGGALFDPHNVVECRQVVESILNQDKEQLGLYNWKKVQMMSVKRVNAQMKELYLW